MPHSQRVDLGVGAAELGADQRAHGVGEGELPRFQPTSSRCATSAMSAVTFSPSKAARVRLDGVYIATSTACSS